MALKAPAIMLLLACRLIAVSSLCDDRVKQIFGYLKGASDAQLFRWFFESREKPLTSPILIYFQGGPGASSMISAVSGNGGPCILNTKGDDTSVNKYSYNTFANVMYIDQPAPVGFSKGTTPEGDVETAKSTLHALEAFFSKYRSYNTRVILIGQSYAGHFIPALAQLAVKRKSSINLKGLILGNGWVNPEPLIRSMPIMAYKSNTAPIVITEKEFDTLTECIPGLLGNISDCVSQKLKEVCEGARKLFREQMLDRIRDKDIDQFDLRRRCTEPKPACRYIENFKTYFDSPKVQGYLKVDKTWLYANNSVIDHFAYDYMVDYSPALGSLLDAGLRLPDGREVGKLRRFASERTGGQLSFAQIYKGSHSAAKDAPDAVLKLVMDVVAN
ncbi:hypothetical protein FOL47_010983 [Perkinsus chesapeaki]|uniref:Thymus-specific serine protease n=1 Tax=Perkinsus chesapeaki TaxID=330153 RepID=A0A7J6MP88_PERCH|nr:hypothetical protein FOL47_010983 [Perkinsus chesapeaki]